MKIPKHALFPLSLGILAFILVTTMGAKAQDITHPPTTKTGPPVHTIHTTRVQNAEVIHVSGHDVVVELENGRLELLDLPKDFLFDVDGKHLTVHELTPGTKLTQEIHTVTTPQEVTTVRTVNGKVWYVSGNQLILSFPEGKNKQYTVPEGIVFNIDGDKKTVFDLRKGMEISATVVRVAPQEVLSTHTVVAGQEPLQAKVPFEGPLLIEPLAVPPAPPVTAAVEEPALKELPKTASYLPLVGLMGLAFSALWIGLRVARKVTA
jgi:hypothetical protein